jgi:LmbE family N-acetylglucosaminyl deacetylase
MTLTIKLSDEQATALQAKAAAEGLSVEEWIQKLADPRPSASRPRRHISEIIRENMSRVPPEIMATMPTDGASQHDHYIYGWPKREV